MRNSTCSLITGAMMCALLARGMAQQGPPTDPPPDVQKLGPQVGPFRITQDVAVDASPAAQTALGDMTALIIKGTLSYQACNDTVCFSPQSVPLTWSVMLRQLDRERAKLPR